MKAGGVTGVVALLAAAAAVIAPPPALAGGGLVTGFDDPILFTSSSASTRAEWLGRAKASDAGIVRVDISWRDVARSRPAHPANPADPAYDFGTIDGAVQSASANGLAVMLGVEHAPDWAEGKHRPKNVVAGTWKPDPKQFGLFGQAIAKRYSGQFAGLPRVRYFQAWNEPNLAIHLSPQFKGKKAVSPGIYRRMLNAFYKGVKASQPTASVVNGGTSPYGDKPGGSRMRPLTFLEKLFCLNGRLKPTKCPDKPHVNVIDHHPITDGSPTKSAIDPRNIAVADYHKVRAVRDAAERAHHIVPGGKHPLWATEIWWNTKPPNKYGFPPKKQAKWLEQALYELWKQGAKTVINYEIRDFPYRASDAANTLQSGVFFHSGKRKPSYTTFRFPFVTHRKSKKKVGAWGKAPDSGRLDIQRKAKKGWKTVQSLKVKRGEVFQAGLRQRGAATFRAKVGSSTSAPWRQGS